MRHLQFAQYVCQKKASHPVREKKPTVFVDEIIGKLKVN